MSNNQVEGMMDTTMEKIRQMVDVNSIIGDPITTGDGTTIIPISKVTYGFAAGGSDLPAKKDSSKDLFGGGSGAGITISPVAFLTVCKGDIKLLQIETFNNTADRIVGMVPNIMDKFGDMRKKNSKKSEKKDSDDSFDI